MGYPHITPCATPSGVHLKERKLIRQNLKTNFGWQIKNLKGQVVKNRHAEFKNGSNPSQ